MWPQYAEAALAMLPSSHQAGFGVFALLAWRTDLAQLRFRFHGECVPQPGEEAGKRTLGEGEETTTQVQGYLIGEAFVALSHKGRWLWCGNDNEL